MALTNVTSDLPTVGQNIGDFLVNLAPGIVEFVFTLGIAGAVIGIIYGIVTVVKKAVQARK